MNKKVKILFFGTPIFVTPIVESLAQKFDLKGVVTAPDQIIGRKKILTPSPVKVKAQELGISTILTPTKLKNDEFIELLKQLEVDLIVVAAYGKIIPQVILDLPKYGALNIHPSALPQYRGASPIQSALLNGDEETALTIIKMDAEMDHGPVVFQQLIAISEEDNLATLSKKMFLIAAKILATLIPDFIGGKLEVKEQDHAKATFCKIINKEDGYFDINNPPSAEILERMARAYYPWPNVWTKWSGKVVKFYPEGKVQMEGKNIVNFQDFLNGYSDFPIKEL